jgi:nitrite reductase/ring-hydroxylating ferredoxin subunit
VPLALPFGVEYLVGAEEEIGERERRLVQAGDEVIGVFRVNGKLYAYENRCLHAGGPVCQGEVLPRLEARLASDMTYAGEQWSTTQVNIACPWHGWEYDLETGRCIGMPGRHLGRRQVTVRDGRVYVEVRSPQPASR